MEISLLAFAKVLLMGLLLYFGCDINNVDDQPTVKEAPVQQEPSNDR
jgi:hypothetical protein